jgi:hypothetical protein
MAPLLRPDHRTKISPNRRNIYRYLFYSTNSVSTHAADRASGWTAEQDRMVSWQIYIWILSSMCVLTQSASGLRKIEQSDVSDSSVFIPQGLAGYSTLDFCPTEVGNRFILIGLCV